MKHIPALLMFLVVFVGIVPLFRHAQAAKFSQALVRLDRMQEGSALSGLVCATPSTANAGTEAKVSITFPSDFTLSNTLTNWTTDIADIPSGTTAWPSISSSATQISGSTVTFASSNLTALTRYCFTFSGAQSTTGSAGQKTGTLTTKESDNTTIDQTNYGVTLTASDRVTLSATVPAKPTDFSAIVTTRKTDPFFTELQETEYELTYSSFLLVATPLTVEATWSLGTIVGSGTPSVEILSYEVGSASNAYAGTPPVVDLTNRTITWSIPNFPANTRNQKVAFRLKTTDAYQGPSRVSFDVKGRVLGLNSASVYHTLTKEYQYTAYVTPTPGPTGIHTPSAPTRVPTPTRAPTRPTIENVAIETISAKDAQISVITDRDTTITTRFGTNPTQLDKSITGISPKKQHTITFPDLSPKTQYYFRITVRDTSGRSFTSDLFTFTTARESKVPIIASDKILATSENIALLSPLEKYRIPQIVLPQNNILEVQFSLTDPTPIKSMLLAMRNKYVLGITSNAYAEESLPTSTSMLEIKPGIFAGRLKTQYTPGLYELFAKVHDYNGNIAEQKIGEVRVVQPFLIFEKGTDKPLEHAKVTLSLYNPQTKLYEFISPQALSISNPSYSEPDGRVPATLPTGKYRAVVDGIRYERQIVEFTIGQRPDDGYPTVYITYAPLSLEKVGQYFIATVHDASMFSRNFIATLAASNRFFELNALIVVGCFVLLSLFALASRLRLSLHQLPGYFAHMLFLHPAVSPQKAQLKGTIIDHETDRPIADADIYLLDTATHEVILHTKTNGTGKFTIPILPVFTYSMEIVKAQYHPMYVRVHETDSASGKVFSLVKHGADLTVKERIEVIVESFLSMGFELLLLFTFILTLIVGFSFGFSKVLPFLVLATLNLVFWILHSHNAKHYNI